MGLIEFLRGRLLLEELRGDGRDRMRCLHLRALGERTIQVVEMLLVLVGGVLEHHSVLGGAALR